jgi:hypothetical protein
MLRRPPLSVAALMAMLSCSCFSSHQPPRPAADAAETRDAASVDERPDGRDAGAVDAKVAEPRASGGGGLIGNLVGVGCQPEAGLELEHCPPEEVTAADPKLVDAVTRVLRRTASSNSFATSEFANEVRVRDVQVWTRARRSERIEVAVQYTAHRSGYRDTRGCHSLSCAQPVPAQERRCISLAFERGPNGYSLAMPRCFPGIGVASRPLPPVRLSAP